MAQFFVPTDDNKIVALTKLLFDAAPGATYLGQFKQIAAASSLASLGDWLVGIAGSSNAAVAAQIASSLKLTGQKAIDAAAYAEAKLDAYGAARGQAMLDMVSEIVALQNDPVWGADVNTFIASVNRSYVYSVNSANTTTVLSELQQADEAPDGPIVDLSLALTSATDNFVGTAGNDAFTAFLAQNPTAGGISNTLSSADRLDGGAGTDSLYAEVVTEFVGSTTGRFGDTIDIQPRTKSIEIVEFEARDISAAGRGFGVVSIDAKHMLGLEKIGSTKSDGDLVIENLTTLANDGVTKRNTSDLTITMNHTDNTNSDGDASDLKVLFDDNYLISGQSSEGKAFYWLLDQDSDLVGGPLLDKINVDGIRFSIAGGPVVTLADPAAMASDTHVQFVAALQTALADLIAAGTLPSGTTLTVDSVNFRTTFLDNGSVSSQVPAIVLTTGDGSVVEPIGYRFVEDEPGDFNLWARMGADFETEDQPVSINVELTKVGRGFDGGYLQVGAKSMHNGIPVMNVTVIGGEELPNSLAALGTTGGKLDTVNIKSDRNDRSSYASLEIRGEDDDVFMQDSLKLVNANEFYGDLLLGTVTDVSNLFTLTATGGGDITFYGNLDGNASGNFSYTTGAGDDTVDVSIDGDAVDRVGTSLSINTGAGADEINVSLSQGVSQRTMYLLDNLKVNAGAGDDYVEVNGKGRFDIVAGSGSDFVNINSGTEGDWEFGSFTGIQPFADRVLYQADLTISFAGFEGKARVNTTLANNYIATQLDINQAIIDAIASNPELARLLTTSKGEGLQQLIVESTVGGENALAISLYQPEVVAASAGAGQVVLTTAAQWQAVAQGLIKTGAVANSLTVSTEGDTRTALNTIDGSLDETGAPVGGLGDYDFLVPTTDGSNQGGGWEANANYSEINMGAGSNDLLVLSSHDLSANTLIIDQTFGKVSVVNFFTDVSNGTPDNDPSVDTGTIGQEVGVVGRHALDFTAYLTNTIDPSVANGNNWSVTPVAVTLSGDSIGAAVATANSVTLLSYDETLATSISFANLTAAQLVAALNTAVPATVTGGLNDASLEVVATTNLVGTTQQHIVMVENAENRGEFKVFNLTSNNTNGSDFATGNGLLGTIDFGAGFVGGDTAGVLQEVNLIGSADATAALNAWLGL